MSRYAVTDDGRLLVVWPTGRGDRAAVLDTSSDVSFDDLMPVARALNHLSEALWTTYTHPASEALDGSEPDEHWRRERREDALDQVGTILRSPNLPAEDGTIMMSYNPVIEGANRVGRALHSVASHDLTNTVADEVCAEVDAVRRAALGDLSGRAAQAVTLTRAQASPTQVAEAHRALEESPFGSEDLFEIFEPAAAAVAAAEWLHAAARAVAFDGDFDSLEEVVLAADGIEAMPVRTMAHVIDKMHAGEPSLALVTRLIREAEAVAEGRLPDPAGLLQMLTDAEERRAGGGLEGLDVRLCLLDPRRPAQDLLEDLVEGIRGCLLVFEEENFDVYEDDEVIQDVFLDLVRAEMHSAPPRP